MKMKKILIYKRNRRNSILYQTAVGCKHSHQYSNMSQTISHLNMPGIISLCSCMYVCMYVCMYICMYICSAISTKNQRKYWNTFTLPGRGLCVLHTVRKKKKGFDVALLSIFLYPVTPHINTVLFRIIFLFSHSVLRGIPFKHEGYKFLHKKIYTVLVFLVCFTTT
jgi:hypothetical protein